MRVRDCGGCFSLFRRRGEHCGIMQSDHCDEKPACVPCRVEDGIAWSVQDLQES